VVKFLGALVWLVGMIGLAISATVLYAQGVLALAGWILGHPLELMDTVSLAAGSAGLAVVGGFASLVGDAEERGNG